MIYISLEKVEFIFSRLFFAACVFSLLTSNIYAADITYTGSEPSLLQNKPTGSSLNPSANLLFPGIVAAPEASGNSVLVNIGGGTVPSGVYGGFSLSDSSENNTVTVEKGGANIGAIRGGYVENGPGNASFNSVTVESGTTNDVVIGGTVAGGTGSANENTVTITGGSTRIGTNVAGGFSLSGGVSKNGATIGTGVNVSAYVRGGHSIDGDVTENTVTMTGVTVGYDVFGGQSTTGNVSKNTVAIQNGTINSNGLINTTGTFGGRSDSGDVDGNTLTLTGSAKAYDFVGGGISATGAVTNNNVFVKDTVAVGTNSNAGGVVGGWVTQGSYDATGNGATVTGGVVKGSLIGGRVAKRGSGAATGNATSNSVTLSGGSVEMDAVGGYSEQGSANKNSATFSGGSVAGQAMGGYSAKSSANENNLTISGSFSTSGIAVGGYSAQGVANSNIVTMSGGTVARDILGGYGGTGGAANENSVTVSGGTVTGDAIGGRGAGAGAKANGNSVTMSGGTIAGDILGAWSAGGAANKNIVTMTSGAVGYDIYGGFDNGGGAGNENSVTMTGGTVEHFIYGGKSSGLSNKNSVILGGDAIAGANTSSMVYGGYSTGANATENTVTVNGATAKGSVYGGYSNSATGDATGNRVTLNSGTIGSNVIGGMAVNNANGNFVVINGGTVTGNVFGGYSAGGKNAINNTVTISGTANIANATLLGGSRGAGTGDIFTGNTLNVNGFKGDVTGIMNFQNINFSLSPLLANEDTMVRVTGGSVTNILNSTIGVSFAGSMPALVGSRVSLLDASIGGLNGSINREGSYGTNTAQGIWTYSLSTANNKLDLFVERLDIDTLNTGGAYNMVAGTGSSQLVALDVHNQFSTTNFSMASSASDALATATLHVDGTMKTDSFTAVKKTAALEVKVGTLDVTGGNTTLTLTDTTAWNGSTGVLFDTIALGEGKTLTVAGNGAFGFNQVRVRGKEAVWNGNLNAGGKQMTFFLAPDVSKNDTMLTVQGAGGVDVTNSTVHVGVMGGNSHLHVGDKVVLIDSAAGVTGAPINANSHAEGMQGISLLYDFTLETTSTQVLAYVASEGINPQIKAIAEGKVASLAFINAGADFAADAGLTAMVDANKALKNASGSVLTPRLKDSAFGFAVSGGSSVRTETGSYIKVNGINFLVGTGVSHALNINGTPSELTLGGFFETGNGNVSTHNSFSAQPDVNGSGDTRYTGIGAIAHLSTQSGFYAEGSARLGKVSDEFDSDLKDGAGQRARYSTKATYASLHVGMGKVVAMNAMDTADMTNTLDLYGKYFFTYQGGDEATILNDKFNFDAMTSHRLRGGARYNYALNKDATLHMGAAYEYEFDGKARVSVYRYAIDAPELKGGSGILELGASFRPSANQPLTLNFGLQGYVGKREGVAGQASLKYAF